MVNTSSFGMMDSFDNFGFYPVWISIAFAISAGVFSFPGITLIAGDWSDTSILAAEVSSIIYLHGEVSSVTTFSCSLPSPSLSSVMAPPFFFPLLNCGLFYELCIFNGFMSNADFDSLRRLTLSFAFPDF